MVGVGRVHDEEELLLHRTADVEGKYRPAGIVELRKDIAERQAGLPINHEPERPVLVVIDNEDNRTKEVRVHHLCFAYEKVPCQRIGIFASVVPRRVHELRHRHLPVLGAV